MLAAFQRDICLVNDLPCREDLSFYGVDRFVGADVKISPTICCAGMMKGLDRLIFFANVDFVFLHFFDFVAHLLCDETHLAALVREEV